MSVIILVDEMTEDLVDIIIKIVGMERKVEMVNYKNVVAGV